MPPEIIYSIDSSALIHGWRRAYPERNFAPVWRQLDALIAEGRLRASIEVFNELERKDDELFAWCKERRDALCVEIDYEVQVHLAHIMGTYPRLVDTVKGRSGGDPFVIELARQHNPVMTVVSEESPGRKNSPKIPDVCAAEEIRCLTLLGMIQELDWRF